MGEGTKVVKIQVKVGQANPGTVGSILGQYGVNLMGFCKEFNEKTQSEEKDTVIPVVLTIKAKDKSFTMVVKASPVSQMIKKIVGKGSSEPNRVKVGKLSRRELMAIVEKKKNEMTGATEEAMLKTVAGTAVSMGVEVDLENSDEG